MPDLTPWYYTTGTVASVAVCLGAARALYTHARQRWLDEGSITARHSEALESNTRAADANTQAISQLTGKLDRFADETRATLTYHDTRIGQLEDITGAPRIRHRRDPLS